MAKETEKNNKLEMVPANNQSLFMQASELASQLEKAEKLNLPEMFDLKTLPIGVAISGTVVRLVENFTGKRDMRKARLIECKHANGTEFLLPLTGVIKNALKSFLIDSSDMREAAEKEAREKFKKNPDELKKELASIEMCDFYTLSPEIVGRTLFVIRKPDGTAKKYGDKPMFMFDVRLSKA